MRSHVLIASILAGAISCSTAFSARMQAEKVPATQTPVSSISLSFRTGLFTTAPPYAISLKQDGTAICVVRRPKMSGTYRAIGLKQEFDQIAKELNDCSFWKLPTRFGPIGLAYMSVTISVKSSGATRSIIDAGKPRPKTLGRRAPEGIRKIEETLTTIMHTANWQKVSTKTDISAATSAG